QHRAVKPERGGIVVDEQDTHTAPRSDFTPASRESQKCGRAPGRRARSARDRAIAGARWRVVAFAAGATDAHAAATTLMGTTPLIRGSVRMRRLDNCLAAHQSLARQFDQTRGATPISAVRAAQRVLPDW